MNEANRLHQDSSHPGQQLTNLPVDEKSEVAAAVSILPYLAGDRTSERKAEYLGLRYSGYSVREACEITGITQMTVMRWRDPDKEWYDPTFVELEIGATGDNRKKVRAEVVQLLYIRNWHLLMRYDQRVIRKVLGLETDEDGFIQQPTKEDRAYLKIIRGQYNAAQMQVIEALAADNNANDFDISEFLLHMKKSNDGTREVEVRMKRKEVSHATSDEGSRAFENGQGNGSFQT